MKYHFAFDKTNQQIKVLIRAN